MASPERLITATKMRCLTETCHLRITIDLARCGADQSSGVRNNRVQCHEFVSRIRSRRQIRSRRCGTRISNDGTMEAKPETTVLRDAESVCRWVDERHEEAAALGVDTLLAWSRKGGRACGDALRSKYRNDSKSVMAQNSLCSAMTVNGILVARFGRDQGLQLFESHPKLVFNVWLKKRMANAVFAPWHEVLSRKKDRCQTRHMADAVVAAWYASQGYYNEWQLDLFMDFGSDLIFPAGAASYPWPEPLRRQRILNWAPIVQQIPALQYRGSLSRFSGKNLPDLLVPAA